MRDRCAVAVIAAALLAFAAGCFSPAFEDGQFSCAQTGECPPGFECDPTTQSCVREPGDSVDASAPADADPMAPDASELPDAAPLAPIRLNIDGPETTGMDFPGLWAGDPGASDFCTGSTGVVPASVTGTLDQDLFRFRVFGDVHCPIGSQLPEGEYQVTILMGELFFGPGCPGGGTGIGARIFEIDLEGNRVEQNIDVFAEGGCIHVDAETPGVPVTRTYTVTVSDGTLNIDMPNGQVSAIEVIPQ